MTGESISIEMNNLGVWVFGNYNSKFTTLRFRNAKCVDEDYYDNIDVAYSVDYADTEVKVEESSEEAIEISTEDDGDLDYNDKWALMLNIRSRRNNTGAIDESVNLTALAIEYMYEDNLQGSVNQTEVNVNNSSKANEEDFTKKDDSQHSPKDNVFLKSNGSEGFNGTHVLQDVHLDQWDKLKNIEEPNGWIASEPNSVLPKDDNDDISTLYFKPSSVEEEHKKPIQMQRNGSEMVKARNVTKRHAETDIEKENSTRETIIEDEEIELQDSTTDNQIRPSSDIHNSVSSSENITELPRLGNVTSGVPQFVEQNYDKTPVTSTYNNKTDDPTNGGNQMPTTASPSSVPYIPSTQESAHIQTHMTSSVSSQNNIDDFLDPDLAEMFGDHAFKDIIRNIFLREQINEIDSKGNEQLISNEMVENNVQNQSLTAKSNVTEAKHNDNHVKENKKVYFKRMEMFETSKNTNQTSIAMYRRRRKRLGKVKEKRTAVNDGPSNGHGHQKNETLYNQHMAPNNSLHDEVGNGTFSPRGHNPMNLKPRGFIPHEYKSEIVIGVSKGMEGDFEEYDNSLLPDEDKHSAQYILFEEPYIIETEDDVHRYTNPDRIAQNFLRTAKGTKRMYYIAAEEVQWDYAGGSRRNQVNEKPIGEARRTIYKKVVFRQYLDGTFTKPDVVGEYEEHLGILGPIIRAEVEDVIQVTFKNLASKPYSIHAHGVSYEKSSEGYRYDDETQDWLKQDEVIQPQESYVYVWYAGAQSGPEAEGSACKTWAYHSGVNTEKDIHSGLIGPLIICRPGTLDKQNNRPLDAREFILLFMSFDEEKSWYFDKNSKKTYAPVTERSSDGMSGHIFHAINGITYNLQGFSMYQNEVVRWHMLNMGGPKDIHVVNFNGQTMTERIKAEFQHPAYPLMPGTFATVEMKPAKAGIWLLDTEVAEYQQAGMQTLFSVAEEGCNFPLGLASKIVSDDQITASHYIEPWEPKLARLNNGGSYNAWSAHMNRSSLPWIQVDLRKNFIISGIQTQGASKYLYQYYIQEFFVAYSRDKKKWNVFKGNSSAIHKLFEGNSDSSSIKENQFNPPITARYIRLFPTRFYKQPALRMELLGCEVQGCSAPLGMENYNIKDAQITASSYKSSWISAYSWLPSLARLNMAGSYNAWQSKANNNQQWLQIDLLITKKITGIMTQGAKSLTSELYMTAYSIQYSDNGKNWKSYMDSSTSMEKIFKGNSNSFGYVKNEFNPPIFSRYLKIIPKSWKDNIVMRLEVYGCDL